MTEKIEPTSNINLEKILVGLHLLGNVLSPIDDAIGQLRSEFIKFLEDPFDINKIMKVSEQRYFYENHGHNILHAWKAIEICQTYKLPEKPLWAMNAVFALAPNMAGLTYSKGSQDSAIKKAVDVDAKTIAQFHANMHWLDVFDRIGQLTATGIQLNKAIITIAHETGIGSFETIERHYYEIRNIGTKIPLPRPFDP
jgi:hypothetical protein